MSPGSWERWRGRHSGDVRNHFPDQRRNWEWVKVSVCSSLRVLHQIYLIKGPNLCIYILNLFSICCCFVNAILLPVSRLTYGILFWIPRTCYDENLPYFILIWFILEIVLLRIFARAVFSFRRIPRTEPVTSLVCGADVYVVLPQTGSFP